MKKKTHTPYNPWHKWHISEVRWGYTAIHKTAIPNQVVQWVLEFICANIAKWKKFEQANMNAVHPYFFPLKLHITWTVLHTNYSHIHMVYTGVHNKNNTFLSPENPKQPWGLPETWPNTVKWYNKWKSKDLVYNFWTLQEISPGSFTISNQPSNNKIQCESIVNKWDYSYLLWDFFFSNKVQAIIF